MRREAMMVRRIHGVAFAALLFAGCAGADQIVRLQYAPDPKVERLSTAQAVTVFRFADRRGDEGDHGDLLRVGGIYNGYGIRIAKIMAPIPWPDALVQDLTAGFAQRGVEAVAVADQVYVPGSSSVSTPLILAGEIHNFSVESRWLIPPLAHVSGNIRLYDHGGKLLLDKPLSARVRGEGGPDLNFGGVLNQAVTQFVRLVVTDPDLTQRITTPR
jgi:hypothetical protein